MATMNEEEATLVYLFTFVTQCGTRVEYQVSVLSMMS